MATNMSDQLVITPQVLLKAYACGIFPMAESAEDPNLFWIEPEHRGVLPLETFHIPKRLRRTVRQDVFDVRVDTSFPQILNGCAEPQADREKTWINSEIRRLYGALFDMGHCHTVEVWREGRLVGGLYGVSLGAAFFGESMFARERDASKVALVHLVARLLTGGYTLLDTQFVTGHLAQFGTREVPKARYDGMLEAALQHHADFLALPDAIAGREALSAIDAHLPPCDV
ncbi:leucyl/phenylalanyl-tRNA--protein transferase [Stappia sp. ES.058]|uniref:leucyl/phenylalanyl-tRNA--protein transferase n=1 Tax=Stappia sp. ES.058 TaxID=1881061 RepID=UPI00087A836F|nr:leucyl/phenylalanyl-tRNA--protein transferase [Stappia sp. ES.058]SDU17506.1 leucyl/phenylalanyl-tRNA--protein transferase [Stappia sp. ES.058]